MDFDDGDDVFDDAGDDDDGNFVSASRRPLLKILFVLHNQKFGKTTVDFDDGDYVFDDAGDDDDDDDVC